MPIRRKVVDFGDDLGEYAVALLRHWRALVSGAVLSLASWGYGVAKDKAVPTSLYLWLLVGAAIVAGFLAWRDEYKKRLSGEISTTDNSPTLRERVRILSAQISRFYSGRSDATPSALSLPILSITPQEWNDASHNSKLYHHETNDLYLQRFATQVTLILKELAKHGAIDAELNAAYLLNSDSLIGIVEVAERLNALADRLPPSEATAPDVTMQGTYPGQVFTLHARGHACEIRTGPLIIESAVTGTMRDGDRTMRTVMPRYTIEFNVVSDLRDGDKEVVEPSLFCGEDYSRSAWPEKESKRTGMAEFFRWAECLRRIEIGEPDVNTCTDAEMNDFAERIRRPLTFSFDITFWNSEHTQQWKRSELLVYEPVPMGTAFVRHVGVPEPLRSPSIGPRPLEKLKPVTG